MQKHAHTYLFNLQLSHAEISRYYQGGARDISVRSNTGQQLRFAARHLRPFLTQDGIQGCFRLTTDANNRFQALEKLA